MAGQPQDNPWTQQGHGYSQGAPGNGPGYDQQQGQPAPYQNYQQQPPQPYEQQQYEQQQYDAQPAYSEQPTVYDQQAVTYEPQPTIYEQVAQEPPQPYSGQPQPGHAQPGHPQPGQPQPDAQGQPPQGWEQWQLPQQQARPQANQARAPKPKKSGEPGFVGSLFDFGFSSFVTPKIIKALYALVAVWTILWAVILLFIGNHLGHVAGLLFVLIIVDPILILVSLGTLRVVLEFFMVTFRMQEDLKALRDRAAATAGGDGDTVTTGTTGTGAV